LINEHVPQDVIESALRIQSYFKSQGKDKWQLCGIESRDYSLKECKGYELLNEYLSRCETPYD